METSLYRRLTEHVPHLTSAADEQRVEAEPALVVPGRPPSQNGCLIGVASKSRITRPGAVPAFHARSRASACARRSPPVRSKRSTAPLLTNAG